MLLLDFNNLFLFFSSLFFVGILGIALNSRNFIYFMVYMEIIYLNISFLFIIISSYAFNAQGELFSFFILSIAAAEAALGFALLILILNKTGSIMLKDFHNFNI